MGITYRQLDYWARTGLLRPSITDAQGSGTQRRYSYHDVLELKVIKQLLDAGINLKRARKAIECLRSDMEADLATTSLVLSGSTSVLAHSDGEVVDLLRGGQGVLNVVALAGVVDSLDAAVVELGATRTGEPRTSGAGSSGGTGTSGGTGASADAHPSSQSAGTNESAGRSVVSARPVDLDEHVPLRMEAAP